MFEEKTGTKKQIFLTLITTMGFKKNIYSEDLVHSEVVLKDLFDRKKVVLRKIIWTGIYSIRRIKLTWTESVGACPVNSGCFILPGSVIKNLCWKQKLNWVQRQSAAKSWKIMKDMSLKNPF